MKTNRHPMGVLERLKELNMLPNSEEDDYERRSVD